MEITQENNKIVHGLWVGEYLSPLELLCIESFINAGHIFYLWTYQPIANIPEKATTMDANEILPEKKIFSYNNANIFGHGKGSYAGFSDIFRYKLLYKYGGWWTDMDVTCLRPLYFYEPYVFRINGKKGIVGNVIKCPANSELMKYCYERAEKEMDANNTEWLLPVNILNDGIKYFKLEQYKKEFTNEDSWPLVSSFLLNKYNINESWFAFHWMNEEWRRFKINKNAYIPSSTIENLLSSLQIKYETLDKKDIRILKHTLGKWNYRFVNIRARISWYYYSLLQRFR